MPISKHGFLIIKTAIKQKCNVIGNIWFEFKLLFNCNALNLFDTNVVFLKVHNQSPK